MTVDKGKVTLRGRGLPNGMEWPGISAKMFTSLVAMWAERVKRAFLFLPYWM